MTIARAIADAALGIFPPPTTLRRYTTGIQRAVPIALTLATGTHTAVCAARCRCAAGRTTHNATGNTTDSTGATGIATAAITAEAIGGITKTDNAIAMHPFTVAAATARTVGVKGGVVIHILRLARFTIHLDVINLHIAITGIVSVFDIDITGCATAVNVVLITRAQGPALHRRAANTQRNLFSTRRSSCANRNTSTVTGAASRRRIIGGAVARIIITFANRDIRIAAALITLGSQHHVIMVTQIQTFAAPEIHMIGKGDRAGNIAKTFLGERTLKY